MRVLITGSSGLVGSAIAARLSDEHEVIGLDIAPGPFTHHIGSITHRLFVANLARDVDAIIHTAALHAPHVGVAPDHAFVEINVNGTLNLLEAAAQRSVQRFIYTSSTSVYGNAMLPRDRAVWVTEALRPEPRDIYDETKLAAENLCKRMAETRGFTAKVLRISRCFPESEEQLALYRLHRGIDLRDVAEAHAIALASPRAEFDLFNISARSPFEEWEMYDLLHDAPRVLRRHFPNIKPLFAKRGWKLPESIGRVYVTEKAEELLKFRSKFNFDSVFLKASL